MKVNQLKAHFQQQKLFSEGAMRIEVNMYRLFFFMGCNCFYLYFDSLHRLFQLSYKCFYRVQFELKCLLLPGFGKAEDGAPRVA